MKNLLILLCCLTASHIQMKAGLVFRTFDVKSGISDNYVLSILRDQYGFMWFGTINGLNRYDGYQCKQYTTTQLGTYNNCINSVVEDASGCIWIKTPGPYLCYNRELDEIDKDIFGRLSRLGINVTHLDLLNVDCEQNLWCVADGKLYYYIFKDGWLRQLLLPEKKLLQVVSRQQRSFLLFDDGEVMQVNWQTGQLQKILQLALPLSGEHRMYMDTQWRLWIYTIYSSYMQCYDTGNRTFVHFWEADILKTDFIKAIVDDGAGNIWMGTNSQGIYILDKGQNNFMQIDRSIENPFSLPSNHINCLYKDNQEIMWIGTTKQGIAFTCLDNTSFEVHQVPELEDISCFQEDRNGYLWLGLDGKGLLCYDSARKTYKSFNTSNSCIPSDLIIGSYLDADGKLWFGSYGNGIFYKKGATFCSLNQFVEGEENPMRYVRHFTKDQHGNLWIGTFMHGLYCLNRREKFIGYTMKNSCLRTNSITDLAYSEELSILYVGTSTGLYVVDVQTKQISFVNGNSEECRFLDKIHVNCLYRDSRGLLWIGTQTGIRIYDEKKGTLVRLSTDNGLSHSYVRGIVEDFDKNIWATTDYGITHIVVGRDSVERDLQYYCYPYFEEDGIGNIHFCNYSIYCNSKGEILMGGTGKYLKIHPVWNKYHANSHKVIFTGLYLANQRIDVGTMTCDGRILLQKNIQQLNEITVNYSDHNFALEVSAMDYGTQHKIQFTYRLGAGEEWIKLEGNKIYFNKLSPGTYQLQVRVNEVHGTNSPISNLTIRVCPPFWLSGIAYAVYVLLALIIIVFVFGRIRAKHRRILVQQKRELEIRQQLEMDEAKMRFFTNVSHDLRTPLSLIITPLEKLLYSEKDEALQDDLRLMYRNATTLLNEVNQLLDFRKLDQQKVQLSLSYGDLTDFIAETCVPFESLSQKYGIILQVHVNTPKIEMNFDRNKMQRILFNLLSNAIKYNHENGSVMVSVDKHSTSQGECVRIKVADSGIGIKDENKEKIFDRFFQERHVTTTYMGSGIGLHIVKEYVTLHGGEITVVDNKPQGSVFTVLLPIVQSDDFSLTKDEAIEVVENESLKISVGQSEVSLLIVEDNDDFRSFLMNCLKEHYQVFEASNVKEALSILACQSVSIIISDVMMPVMDGIELCRKVKSDIRYSHIPVILLTARTAEDNILGGLKEGADEYITKPFNLEILLLRIRKLLEWAKCNYEKFNTVDISPSEITISTLDEQLIEKSIRIVEDNMDNSDFSVEEFSAAVGMSRSGLYKKLMQITGKSPLEFIRILRLKRGKKLLDSSQLSVSQIAYQVGLSPKQFAKFFKEEFGYLPSEYKKECLR